jgi:inner membrane protein
MVQRCDAASTTSSILPYPTLDNLTHTLFALTLANGGLRRAGRGATAALVIASNIPDIEILTTFTGGRVAYLSAHRGPTHGPAALLLAAATALGVWLVQRRPGQGGEDRAAFLPLLGVASIGVAAHIAMDFFTSYGTRVLSPFTPMWYGVDWMPIADIGLIFVLAAGAIWAWLRPALAARVAAAVLAITACDYAARGTLHASALARANELARSVSDAPAPTATPGAIFSYLGREHPAPLPAALPTLGSPFRWRLVVAARDGYLVTEVDVRDRGAWQRDAIAGAVWFPNDSGPLIERAAAAHLGTVFLNFSRFPSAEVVTHANGDLTVHWYDLRFAERRAPVGSDRRQHTSPFGAWVRLSPTGTVVAQGLGPG